MSLTENEEIELIALLEADALEREMWRPDPENIPQQDAYNSLADELFYGGAAGGGKSDLGLGLAVTRHHRSLILRRESTQLRALLDRSRAIIGTHGRLNESPPATWRLNNGRIIELAGCKDLSDRDKFQGRPHDLLVFDEAPQFLEQQVTFISGWARTENPKQRVRVVLTGNPPTSVEGMWIVRRYAAWLDEQHPNPARPGELRWYAIIDGEEVELLTGDSITHNGETIYPKSRTFIPASVDDNPAYRDTGYKAQLQALPEPLRSQMLYGSFVAGTDDDPWQVIPTAWVRAAQVRWKELALPEGNADMLGVDVARGGRDKTIIAPRWGAYIGELKRHPGASTPNGPAVAALVMKEMGGATVANIDIIGVGSSVYDTLRAYPELITKGINVAECSKATDRSGKLHFVNKRAQIYWQLREMLDPDTGDGLAIPPDPEILADLCCATWSMTIRGILVEGKDDIKKRLGRSPDCGDAVALATYVSGGVPYGVVDLSQFGKTVETGEIDEIAALMADDDNWTDL